MHFEISFPRENFKFSINIQCLVKGIKEKFVVNEHVAHFSLFLFFTENVLNHRDLLAKVDNALKHFIVHRVIDDHLNGLLVF